MPSATVYRESIAMLIMLGKAHRKNSRVGGIFVGRYVGPNALAAVNLVMPLIMMSFARCV